MTYLATVPPSGSMSFSHRRDGTSTSYPYYRSSSPISSLPTDILPQGYRSMRDQTSIIDSLYRMDIDDSALSSLHRRSTDWLRQDLGGYESRPATSTQSRIIKRIPITDGDATRKKKEPERTREVRSSYRDGSGVGRAATMASTGTSSGKPSTARERRRETMGSLTGIRGNGSSPQPPTADPYGRVTGMYSPTLRSTPSRRRSVTFDDTPTQITPKRAHTQRDTPVTANIYPSPTSPDMPAPRAKRSQTPPLSLSTRRTPSPVPSLPSPPIIARAPSLPPTPPKSPITRPSSPFTRARKPSSSPLTPTSPRERLFTLLQESNFVPIDVPGTGNCLFSALADQAWGDKDRHREMRSKIAEEIDRNRGKYEAEVVVSEMEKMDMDLDDGGGDDGTDIFQKYLDRIRTDGKVGDAICIAAYATIFKSDVIVHIVDDRTGQLGSFTIEYSGNEHKGLETHIGWYRSDCGIETANHYISVFTPQ